MSDVSEIETLKDKHHICSAEKNYHEIIEDACYRQCKKTT